MQKSLPKMIEIAVNQDLDVANYYFFHHKSIAMNTKIQQDPDVANPALFVAEMTVALCAVKKQKESCRSGLFIFTPCRRKFFLFV